MKRLSEVTLEDAKEILKADVGYGLILGKKKWELTDESESLKEPCKKLACKTNHYVFWFFNEKMDVDYEDGEKEIGLIASDIDVKYKCYLKAHYLGYYIDGITKKTPEPKPSTQSMCIEEISFEPQESGRIRRIEAKLKGRIKTTSTDCYYAIRSLITRSSNIGIPRVFFYPGYESDFIRINKKLLVTEFEIKTTKADFLNDFKKCRMKGLKNDNKHEAIKKGLMANYFYFVAPKGVLEIADIPKYCGFIEVDKNHLNSISIIKKAPRIHSNPTEDPIFNVARLMTYKLRL